MMKSVQSEHKKKELETLKMMQNGNAVDLEIHTHASR
jgi:hypothetical protein